MYTFDNKINSLINLVKRGYKRFRGRRLGKKKNKASTSKSTTLRYGLSTKPQTLGKGSTKINVTYDDVVGSALKNYEIADIIGNNTEMTQTAIRYRWFKVSRISIIVYSHNFNSETYPYPTYVRMLWTDDTATNIEKDDSTKIVSSYSTRNKMFVFIPPNASLPITSVNTSIKQINYREWVIADDIFDAVDGKYKLPGTLQVVPTADDLRIRIEALVEFRGRKELDPESLSRLINELKIEKEKDEEKKKEKERIFRINKIRKGKELNIIDEEESDSLGERLYQK